MSSGGSGLKGRTRPQPLAVPADVKLSYILTNSGKFTEGGLTISREGLQIQSPAGSTRPGSASSEANGKHLGADEASGRSGDEPSSSTSTATPTGVELTLEDLEDLGIIGSGSSGIAKKVRNKLTGGLLVLKVIQFDVSSDTIRKQVTTELRTLYGACHRNIVRYNQAFFDNGAITIVMEYCDGGSLADVLRAMQKTRPGQPVPERFIAEIGRQVVKGLLHLHKELHVVHRDIKPSNLLLTSKGDLKISDFGVSGQLTSSVSNCLSWVGTVTYMSPERIKGDEYSYDSDIWSLGLTLVECALGRYPYPPGPGDANTTPQPLGFWELLEYIVMEAPPVLSRADHRFSPELCDFIGKCLVKDTQQRPSIESLAKHAFLNTHKPTDLSELLTWCLNPDT